MNGGQSENRRRMGSVKAAMSSYGERSVEGDSPVTKLLTGSQVDSPWKGELHQARRNIGQFKESRRVAESTKSRVEAELNDAKKTVRDLSSKIEESNARAKGLQNQRKPKWCNEESDVGLRNNEDYQYAEVMKELEHIKKDLSKLKLDMSFVLEEKRRAEKQTKASTSRMWSHASSMETIKRQIQELNEEQVLVELAQIEAVKETQDIEIYRKKDADQYKTKVDETRKKINDIDQEIEQARELENRLALTISDINMLENELTLFKEMDRSIERSESLKHVEARKVEEAYSPSLLKSVTEELEAAKTELANIKEEGFNFMASMDVIRDELRHVREERARLEKMEGKRDLTVQNLNAKILRATSKLVAMSAAGEKADTIASNMSQTLEQLKTEAEAAKKESDIIREETEGIKAEIPKMESEIDLAEEKLQAAMEELQAVKLSETQALDNLKVLVENTMRGRVSACQHSSTTTISAFEYEYLTGRAGGAEEIADKKVAAAQAWVEALKANEKEILMKVDMAQREIKEQSFEDREHVEVYEPELPVFAKRDVAGEFGRWGHNEENLDPENSDPELELPRKSMYRNGNMTPGKRARLRKFGSPVVRHTSRSSSVTIRRRGKVMPNIAKFFSNKNIETES